MKEQKKALAKKKQEALKKKKQRQEVDGKAGLPEAGQYLHMVPAVASSLKPAVFDKMK